MAPAGPPSRVARARPKSRTPIMLAISVDVARFSCSSPVPTPDTENSRAGRQLGSTARLSAGRVAAVVRFLRVRTPRDDAGRRAARPRTGADGAVAASGAASTTSSARGSAAGSTTRTSPRSAAPSSATGRSPASTSPGSAVSSGAMSSTAIPWSVASPARPESQPWPIARNFHSSPRT